MASVADQVRDLLRPLSLRIANSIARAVVQVVDDDKKLQLLQLGVLVGEDRDECERFQQYGFSSVPHMGAEAVVIFPNGDRAHALVIAVDDRRYRPTGGEPGDVRLYNQQGILALLRGTELRLGSPDATEPTFRANAFLEAFGVLVDAIGSAAAGTGSGVTSAITTALETFQGVTGYLTTKVKVE